MKDMNPVQGSRTVTLRDLPDELDSGAEARFRIEVTAEPPLDPAGQEIEIVDAEGAPVARAPLAPAGDGEPAGPATADIALRAPDAPGSHGFTARLAPHETEDVAYPAAEVELRLDVVAHRVAPVVWDVPQAVPPGTAFTVKVGARCSSGCDPEGWTITIRDAQGRTRAETTTGALPWPGTTGLHYAEVALKAPDGIGLETWQAVVAAPGAALPHVEGCRGFGVRTTPPTDARLRVEAVDSGTGAALPGMKVVVHPFSAVTGADGTAEIAVPSGTHRVFVSGKRYIPYRIECAVEGEESLRAELEPDTGLSEAMIWG